ncbi:immunity protein YezG family protein [Nocardiopsis lambiniae]|uniref:DUF600 family protein n=1 Tax=Nocardiopsis lambiniae TaxID=3075539 RepID=A0ABU2M2G1_9ACTN|nr:immunity protein YezG family protein [Nocardiopsis sp. DSM 44743]MDT0326815.1 DUF600 family protein [Nocardiopsis sp. DSM 44743]
MIERSHLKPQEQQEILQKIGGELLTAVSDEWETITYTACALIGQMSERLEETRAGGEPERRRIPLGVIDLVRELRAGMYQENKGTWFTLTYTITRPGKFKADYDYDGQPRFVFYPQSSDFALDLRHFPRDPEYIPDWLNEKLREEAGGTAAG